MNRDIYASWEVQHGFDRDIFLRNEQSRAGEYQIKRRPISSQFRSRAQWAERGRRVLSDVAPAKVLLDVKNNHQLRLYSFEQTVSL
jgi:hypothetical protein